MKQYNSFFYLFVLFELFLKNSIIKAYPMKGMITFMFRRKEEVKYTKEQLHRNIALTTAVLIIIEALFITLIIVQKRFYMIWAPIVVVILYVVALLFDLGRLKDLEEEENEAIENNTSIVEKETKNEEK